jgi:hypothetical protein
MDCRIQTLASSATKKQKQWTIFCWAAPSAARSLDRGLEDYTSPKRHHSTGRSGNGVVAAKQEDDL